MEYHDYNAETAILSAMMIDTETTAKVVDIVSTDDFHNHNNRMIFTALLELFESNTPIDIITLANKLKTNNQLELVGGMIFLNQLSDIVFSGANVEQHSDIIKKKRILRESVDLLKKAVRKIEGGDDYEKILDITKEKLMDIGNDKEQHNYSSSEAVKKTMKQISDIMVSGKSIGLKTYIHDLDYYIVMKPGNLITIGAKSGTGKTMLANQIGFQNVLHDKKVCFINMEMEYDEIINREISRQSRINLKDINHGNIKDSIDKYTHHATALSECVFHIDDNGKQTIPKIRSRLINYKNKMKGLDLVIIDYFQLIEGGKGDTRQQQLGYISRKIKQIAKHFQVPIIMLSQLSEENQTREAKDLKQDSDVLLLLFRPAYDKHGTHLKNGELKIKRDGDWVIPEEHFVSLEIAKQRGGEVGKIRLSFDGSHQQFNGWLDDE